MKKTNEEIFNSFIRSMTENKVMEIARNLSFVDDENLEEDEYKRGMYFGIIFGLEFAINKLKGKHDGR